MFSFKINPKTALDILPYHFYFKIFIRSIYIFIFHKYYKSPLFLKNKKNFLQKKSEYYILNNLSFEITGSLRSLTMTLENSPLIIFNKIANYKFKIYNFTNIENIF